jgi:2,4-dienoyl-CoA reductase-like NADH-dependent reductase (Old Yellow Enzyme family)/thioredoxin reductase
MSAKYQHLLSPLKVGNRILKNRLISTPSGMHMNRASEPFPTDTLKAYYEGKARNGAAMMTINGMTMFYDQITPSSKNSDFDIRDGRNRRALADLVNGIQMYGALATVNMHLELPKGYDVSGEVPNQWLAPHGMEWGTNNRKDLQTASIDMIEAYAEEYTNLIAVMKDDCGFDGAFLHMAYRMMPLGRFLSPLTNKRTDKYGGSLENRFRYPKLIADLIKRKCGKDFLIEASISGCDPDNEPGGLTTDDVAEYVKMAAGSFDMLQIKAPLLDPAHPTQFHGRTPWLNLEAEVREKSGRALPIMAVGGFSHPDDGEAALVADKTDLIGMGRSWISNPEWVKLMYEDRADDIIPCLRCNKCHRSGEADPIIPVCSVNPTYGIEQKQPRVTKTPERIKKLAVVGGGPAGMRTAIFLAERGHKVTIIEEKAELGGQLQVTRDVSFKWTLQDYKQWLINQVGKKDIDVSLNTRATRELLAAGDFEEIFICVGAEPLIPAIPGINGKNVMTSIEAYAKYRELGNHVAIIGGGEIGVETGIYLARMGRNVTVLEMRRLLAMDATPIHYYSMFREEWEKTPTFKGITNATAVGIDEQGVIYKDERGVEHKVLCDNVLVSTGMKPRSAEGQSLFVPGIKCQLVGDCYKVGNIQKVNRNAFGVASAV